MPTSPVPSSKASRRSVRLGAVLVVAALALAAVGCSSDSDDAKPAKTTTTKPVARPTTSTTVAPTTTGLVGTTSTTVVAPAPTGPQDYRGAIDGQDKDKVVTFTRDGDITDFVVTGLSIECQPLKAGEPTTRATRVTIPKATVKGDGSVEHTESGSKYKPTLTGSFTKDGSFAGGLYLSGQDDGYVCGGEFTFIAKPA